MNDYQYFWWRKVVELNSNWNYVSFTKKKSCFLLVYTVILPFIQALNIYIYVFCRKKYILREITLIYDHNISAYYCQHFFITHYINKEINVDTSLRNKCYYLLGNCCWSLPYTPPKFTLYKLTCILRPIKLTKA